MLLPVGVLPAAKRYYRSRVLLHHRHHQRVVIVIGLLYGKLAVFHAKPDPTRLEPWLHNLLKCLLKRCIVSKMLLNGLSKPTLRLLYLCSRIQNRQEKNHVKEATKCSPSLWLLKACRLLHFNQRLFLHIFLFIVCYELFHLRLHVKIDFCYNLL